MHRWCNRHMEHTGQNEFSRWLDLPGLLLPEDIALLVRRYGVHPGGDFHEQVALYLPSDLLSLYMNVGYGFCVKMLHPRFPVRKCARRNEMGLLTCGKDVQSSRYTIFCSWGCQNAHCGGVCSSSSVPRNQTRDPVQESQISHNHLLIVPFFFHGLNTSRLAVNLLIWKSM